MNNHVRASSISAQSHIHLSLSLSLQNFHQSSKSDLVNPKLTFDQSDAQVLRVCLEKMFIIMGPMTY